MKKYIYSFALFILFFSCEYRENKIELIPDYDSVYLTEKQVDVPAKEKDTTSSDKLAGDINGLFKKLNNGNPKSPVLFKTAFRVYVNENGEIDKIKILNQEDYDFNIGEVKAENFSDQSKINNALPELLDKYSFEPAVKNGKPVKFRNDIAYAAIIYPDGELKSLVPFNISLNFSSSQNKEYLISVTEQPFPEGGLMSIMKKIKYPEAAKLAGIQGRVLIKAFLNDEGLVVKTELLKGIGYGCDEAAATAVQKTKFKPGMLNGKPVKTQVVIPIMFKLQ